MSEANVKLLDAALAELKGFAAQSKHQYNKDVLAAEINKLQTVLSNIKQISEITNSVPAATAVPTTVAPKPAPTRYCTELTQYAFDQSDKFVKLFVTLDGAEKCPADNVRATFTESSILLTVSDLANKDYELRINNLLHPIDVAASYCKPKTGMVVIYARKAKTGEQWSDLTLIEKRLRDSKSEALAADKGDPGDIMGLMKKMYNSGDPEMKRLIAKSWTESNEKKNGMDVGE